MGWELSNFNGIGEGDWEIKKDLKLTAQSDCKGDFFMNGADKD